ncbi:MAG: hypothetical protein CL610_29365 [Anaerolineaceae bacterium]|nr:hypothetical protein [Anaerolineaceae bacterium]
MLRILIRLLTAAILLTLTISVAVAQEDTYEDPQGRYNMPIPENWTVEENDAYTTVQSPEGTIKLYFMVAPLMTDTPDAVAAGWQLVKPDFAAEQASTLEPPSQSPVDSTLVVNYDLGDDNVIYQAVAQVVGDQVYLLLVEGPLTDIQRRQAQITVISTGYTISGTEQTDLTGVEPRTIDAEMTGALEDYINVLMPQLKIPGAVVAIVQNGEIVYMGAFGTREMGSDSPMTVDTHMMIGSSGKSLTTTMMATLVDDGLMTWDTPAQDILPQFEMADAELSEQITMRNLVCACTGVPRRDFEFLFNANSLTAEDVVESLSTFEVFTDFGEAFQYSNQMVATGGYIAAAAGGGEWGNLFDSYAEQLQARVLDPVGMPLTTISFEDVIQRGEYATPHALVAGFEYEPLPLDTERTLMPIAPAGSHWSTVEDMAHYIIMQLNNGTAADGTEVVSAENLLITREPQVAVSADDDYGLGWIIAGYKGLPLIEHGGNTLGFTSDLAFLPDTGVGIVVLTNTQVSNVFNISVRSRLFDLVFDDVDAETDAENMAFTVGVMDEQYALPENLADSVDASVVEAYTGTYTNAALGDIVIELTDGTLTLDAGEFSGAILPLMEEDNPDQVDYYITVDPPVSGLQLHFEETDDGTIHIVAGQGVTEYTFTPVE